MIYDRIFGLKTEAEFSDITLEIFRYQYDNNDLYREFCSLLGRKKDFVKELDDIPFLPVGFFRNHKILTGKQQEEIIFRSSSTTGAVPSLHYVSDPGLYERSFLSAFRLFYGDPGGFVILALLPSYTGREGSSLVYMTDRLIKETGHNLSGFYRTDPGQIRDAVHSAGNEGRKVLLLGVSFALLDLAERGAPDMAGTIVMETGGMKGRRKEITRGELHAILKKELNLKSVHSEYGMTELLSQAYSRGEGLFYSPPWMKILIRDPQDPLSFYSETGRTGGISIIDLANINSCSFLAIGDLGKLHPGGGFEILGRFDNSDIRGCNLMAE
jgi:phenylacetate-coenzyme A ligase PaaK-like adenylate-forming protein